MGCKDAAAIAAEIVEEDIDVVLIDYNLGEDFDGGAVVKQLHRMDFRGLLVMCSGDDQLQLDETLEVHAMLPKTREGAFGPHFAGILANAWATHRHLYKERVVVVDDQNVQRGEGIHH